MKVGRTRERLSKMLIEQGIHMYPHDMHVNYGYNNKFWDCCSWNGPAHVPARQFNVNVCSWYTMADLVKHGFTITQDDIDKLTTIADLQLVPGCRPVLGV